ncbi:hypothetical protein HCJ92_19860, partial [Streptomyces sp. ventii]|nr:hypothetical protein [Streptomyces spiramenti]
LVAPPPGPDPGDPAPPTAPTAATATAPATAVRVREVTDEGRLWVEASYRLPAAEEAGDELPDASAAPARSATPPG